MSRFSFLFLLSFWGRGEIALTPDDNAAVLVLQSLRESLDAAVRSVALGVGVRACGCRAVPGSCIRFCRRPFSLARQDRSAPSLSLVLLVRLLSYARRA